MSYDLQLGDVSNEVKILQEKLKMLGFYNAVITGNFGKATEVAVKAFQAKENLSETGIVDKETWDKLNSYTELRLLRASNYPTISSGATGTFVRDLQTKLKALLYYSGDINGNFDLETENAVKRFQLNNELIATGIVNQDTWALLNSLYGNLNVCALEENKAPSNQSYLSYQVQKNDTLYSIAKKFDTTVDEIKSLNNLPNNILTIGSILKIPSDSNDNDNNNETQNYLNYVVQKNDTLYSIAKKYNTTVDEIKILNNLPNNILTIGSILKIPSNSNNNDNNNETPNYLNYVVQKNDTLYSIAKKYNTTVDEIKSLNNLSNNLLTIGSILKIPSNSNDNNNETQNYLNYVVQKNDTLYSIAKKYKTTVDEIKTLNNLSNNILTIGSTLKIPTKKSL